MKGLDVILLFMVFTLAAIICIFIWKGNAKYSDYKVERFTKRYKSIANDWPPEVQILRAHYELNCPYCGEPFYSGKCCAKNTELIRRIKTGE